MAWDEFLAGLDTSYARGEAVDVTVDRVLQELNNGGMDRSCVVHRRDSGAVRVVGGHLLTLDDGMIGCGSA